MPGETVEIIKPFQDYKGLFLYHCHNLEHEDLGMMRQFLIDKMTIRPVGLRRKPADRAVGVRGVELFRHLRLEDGIFYFLNSSSITVAD